MYNFYLDMEGEHWGEEFVEVNVEVSSAEEEKDASSTALVPTPPPAPPGWVPEPREAPKRKIFYSEEKVQVDGRRIKFGPEERYMSALWRMRPLRMQCLGNRWSPDE